MRSRWWQKLPFRLDPPSLPDPLWRRAMAGCAMARRLDPDRQLRLRQLAALFTTRKRYHALGSVVLDDYWRLLIAMQACLPALRLGSSCLRGWRDVLVYPGEFRMRHAHQDGYQPFSAGGQNLLGVSYERGPLVLSLADVQLDLEQPWDGYNVVLHEVARKLDLLDGPADGVPPLADISRRRWVAHFQAAHERLAASQPGENDAPFDRYAAASPGNYFAVVSELHYSQPGLLRFAEPEIARLLEAFYGTSPADGSELPAR